MIATIQHHDSKERFCRLGAQVEFGQPTFTDEHSIRLDGNSYSAKTWVIATGSSPVAPPIKGLAQTNHITNKEIFYLDHLPESMIILGGGPIGVEMSQAFCRLGTKVFVVDMAPQILVKEDLDMAEAVKEVLRSEGVEFYLNSSIEEVKDLGREKEVMVKTSQGSLVSLKAETIVAALGRAANVSGLGLEDIGVEFSRQGINVDNRLRTNIKHIYAVGDVNGGYQFTHAAGYEGGIVVSNAVFRLPRKVDYTFLPWCTYTDPSLGSIGMNEKSAAEAGIGCNVWTEEFKDNDRSLAEGETVGKIKMILDEKEKPLAWIFYFKPKMFVMENVPQFLTKYKGATYKEVKRIIERDLPEYHIVEDVKVLNSVNYGVPQNRRRMILVGHLKNHTFKYPKITNNIHPNDKNTNSILIFEKILSNSFNLRYEINFDPFSSI